MEELDGARVAAMLTADAELEVRPGLAPGGDGVTLVEVPAGADAAAVASGLDASLLLVGAPGSALSGGPMLIASTVSRDGKKLQR